MTFWPPLDSGEVKKHSICRKPRAGAADSTKSDHITASTLLGGANPIYNSFVMPAIMIAYYTEPGYDDIQMLATSGLIVSHEIGHLFDTRGAIYDEYGILRDWWSPQMKEQFDQLEGKISEYFAAAELLPGVRQEILSERHDEAIAEYVGMVLALDVVGDNPDDQRKFLETYASANWAIGTQGGILDRWKMDDHLAEILRCNAIPPCLDSFYDLYDIIEGDPMYVPPEKRPKLW